MDIQTLENIKNKYRLKSSWAVWNPNDFEDTNIIDANPDKLKPDNYVMVGLNKSGQINKNWGNFHASHRGSHDKRLMEAFNDSNARGAYMTDLLEKGQSDYQELEQSKSLKILNYLISPKNKKDIISQIQSFQEELKIVGVTTGSKFILFGNTVKQYFTFFINEEFAGNEIIYLSHYSEWGNDNDWIKVAQDKIKNA